MALIKVDEEEDSSFAPMRPWWDEIAKACQTTGGDLPAGVRKLLAGLTTIELDDVELWLLDRIDILVESSGAYDGDDPYDDAAFIILQGEEHFSRALGT